MVIDAMELRRAGIVALVEPWAESLGISTVATSPQALSAEMVAEFEARFVIFSIGGISLHAAEPIQWAGLIRDLLPGVPCVVLSDRVEPEEAIVAARLGEQAFMPTNVEPKIALQAFAFIIGGGTYFPREALLQSVSATREGGTFSGTVTGDPDRLTRRQHEVLERLRLGKSNKLIARDLDMQESTVKVHVRQIMRKLGAANRTQAALLAVASSRSAEQRLPMTVPIPATLPAQAALPAQQYSI